MTKINVLIFPAGEINAIELHTALSSCVNINLYGASSIERHGSYVFQNYIPNVPNINETRFIEKFNQLIDKYSIDLVIPTHDSVALYFAENKAIINTQVLTVDLETALVCRKKLKMFDVFKGCSFIPNLYKTSETIEFPIFVKPNESQGGKGARIVRSKQELEALPDIDDYVINEYLPGDELTVDCITDHEGRLQGVFPRTRQRVFCGVSVAGEAVKGTPEIMEIANTINDRLKLLGLWFFQVKKDKQGNYKLLEISTRVAGGMCLTRARGVNLPLLSVYAAMGYDIEVMSNTYSVEMDRTLINRYKTDIQYEHVYLDFDDTLVQGDEVNLDIIRFVYQCLNQNKKIHLLTKHPQNIQSSLEHFHIDKNIFYEIIHIPAEEHKFSYVTHEDAIFIDNAYQERRSVMIKCGIPVFDIDTVEVLLDWRK